LISLDKLEKYGYISKEDKGVLKILRASTIVIKGVRKNDLYALEGVVVFGLASTAK